MTRLLYALTLTAGCIHELPPVATPGPANPPSATTAVPPGHGLIYVDVVDGPAVVRVVKPVEVTEQLNDQEIETEALEEQSHCTAPCVLDLSLGPHVLAFPMRGSGGVELANVMASPNPTVYRRALGWRRKGGAGFVLGVLGAAFGGASFTTGAVLLPIGLVKDRDGMKLAGEITLGAGAILTAVGIWAITQNPLFEQAGAGAQYPINP